MSKAQFAPALSILALAGSKDAAVEAAFNALQFGLLQIIAHGNSRTLTDTLEALAECKGAQGKRVRECVQAAYDAGMLQKLAGKGEADKGMARADALTQAAALAYGVACDTAAEARTEKASATKAAKEKAQKAADKAIRAASAPAKPLTVADALAFLNAACASGDDAALSGIEAMVNRYFDAAVTA
jgi:hypothetical protein